MKEFEKLNIKYFLTKAVTDIFNMMLGIDVELFDPNISSAVLNGHSVNTILQHLKELSSLYEGDRVIGAVGIKGEASGLIILQMNYDLARSLAALALDIDLQKINDLAFVKDMVGEMTNMIAGNLKTAFNNAGLPCMITTIPSVYHGNNFKMTQPKGSKQERYYFRYNRNIALVEVYLSPPKN